MIKTAYSDKYKFLEEERLIRLREVTKDGSQYRKIRAKELSKETNRRRRALDEKKKQKEVEEVEEREAALAERRRQQRDATDKFQKGFLHRKRSEDKSEADGTTINLGEETALPIQDGVHVVQGHVVEIKNGKHVLNRTPALDEALDLVWGGQSPGGIEQGYNQLTDCAQGKDDERLWHGVQHQEDGYVERPSLDNMEGVFFANGTHSGKLGSAQASTLGDYSPLMFSPCEQAELSDMARIAEHERLRQDAISKGGPKLAFMKDTNEQELTEGALPMTMGRDSPSGSLTSLDSLDEVPESGSVSKGTLIDKAKVSGIIAKNAGGKSSAKRRVTFSDSIEFDDGVIGQLVTHQKQSTKNFTALYAKNSVENLRGIPSDVASRSEIQGTVTPKEVMSERTVALSQSQSKNNMTNPVIEMSAGAVKANPSPGKIPAESLGLSVTHSDHPNASASSANTVLESRQSVNSSGLRMQPTVSKGDRGFDMQPAVRPQVDEVSHYTSPRDSLEMMRDSLDRNTTDASDYARSMLGGREQTIDEYSTSTTSKHKKEDLAEEEAKPSSREDDDLRRNMLYHSNLLYHPAVSSDTVNSVPSTQSYVQNYIPMSSTEPSLAQSSMSVTHNYSSTAYSSGQSSPMATAPLSTQQSSHIPLSGCSTVENAHTIPTFSGSAATKSTIAAAAAAIGSSTRGYPYPQLHNKGIRHQDNTVNGSGLEKFEVNSGFDAGFVKSNVQYPVRSFPSQQSPPVVPGHATSSPRQSHPLRGGVMSKEQVSVVNRTSAHNVGSNSAPSNSSGREISTDHTRLNRSRLNSARSKPLSQATTGMRNKHRVIKKTIEVKNPKSASSQRNMDSKRGVNEQRVKGQVGSSNADKSLSCGNQRVQSGRNGAGDTDSLSPSSHFDEDDIINSIRLNMDKINMRARSDVVQIHHQKLMDSLRVDIHSSSAPWREKELTSNALDKGELLENGLEPTRPAQDRIGSATRRMHHPTAGRSIPNESRQAVDSTLAKNSNLRVGSGRNVASHAKQGIHRPSKTQVLEEANGQTAYRNDYSSTAAGLTSGNYFSHQNVNSNASSRAPAPQAFDDAAHRIPKAYGRMFVNSDADEMPAYSGVRENVFEQPDTHLKRSMVLNRTPTDEEINYLWDRVRTCLGTNKQTAGSDSCVATMNAQHSRTLSQQGYPPSGSIARNPSLEDSRISNNASYVGGSTVGGLRRYGSHEVLTRNGSSDSFPLRRPALLQQRAQKSRQSQQGKPPLPRQHNQNFSPVHSRGTPSPSVTSKGSQPLSAHEMRAVMKASEQTQEMLQRGQQDHTPEQHHVRNLLTARKAPSALSLEEQKLLESLDKLNERLKVQEAVTSKLAQHKMNSRVAHKPPTGHSRTAGHHRTTSASRAANKNPQLTVPVPRNYSSTR